MTVVGFRRKLLLSLTFQVADLTLTVRPLLVSVHFIRMKKLRSVLGSLAFLDPEIKYSNKDVSIFFYITNVQLNKKKKTHFIGSEF